MAIKRIYTKGFSVIEIIAVLAIMGIILAISVLSISNLRVRKQVETSIDSINYKLEEAKSNALSGKNGSNHGIYFYTSSYVLFNGNTYNPNDITNSSSTLPTNIQITNSLADSSNVVIFSRMTGQPSTTGTITVTDTSTSLSAYITIGTLGDINVVK